MSEREGKAMRATVRGRVQEMAQGTEIEVLAERAVGEALQAAPQRDAASLLRPQQNRTAVWRWHVRRRQRAD